MLNGPFCSLAAALACVLLQIMGAPHGDSKYTRRLLPVTPGRGGSLTSAPLTLCFLKGHFLADWLGRFCVGPGVVILLTVSLGDGPIEIRLQKGPFNIGLIVTVLGRSYASFLQRLITSADKYFMNGQNVTNFMFTDDLSLGRSIKTKRRIVATEVKGNGWPCNTLLRFGSINTHRKQFANMHFLFALDVDVYLEDMVDTEILENLVGTLHVHYYLSSRASYTYDNNPLSTAYIHKSEGEYYFAGGFFGGCRNAIIQMAETIVRNVKKDLKEYHYIALWHDESHLNRYFIDNLPTKILSPEYLSTPYHKFQRRRIVQIEKGNKVNKKDVGWQKCL